MSAMLKKWAEWTRENVRRIRVDYENGGEEIRSFTFLLRSRKSLVECKEVRRVLARLVLVRDGMHTTCRCPYSIMDALADNALPFHSAQKLVFIFTGRHRRVLKVRVRCFSITVLE